MIDYIVVVTILTIIVIAFVKKVNVFNSFVDGASQSIKLCVTLLPYLVAIFLLMELLKASKLDAIIVNILSYPLQAIGIPKELSYLVIMRPFSGSGSLAILNNILATYGADSYIGRSACVSMASSETVFYIAAVYFADTNVKKMGWAIPIALVCSIVGCALSCLTCRFF